MADIAQSFSPALPHFYCDPNCEERRAIGICDDVLEEEVLTYFGLTYKTFPKYVASYDFDYDKLKEMEREKQRRSERFWPLREEYWLRQVGEYIHDDILFVVGARHITTFADLIQRNSLESFIIEKDLVGNRLPAETDMLGT